jgi:hypothetical protein
MTVKQKIFQVMDSPTVSVELHGQSGGGGGSCIPANNSVFDENYFITNTENYSF